jgi:hypothetical protein
MTIKTTTSLTITGATVSSVPNNIQLSASGTSCACGSTTFTVTAPISGAIPVNFRQTSASIPSTGVLEFHYTWDSSSGNKADLASCQVEEYVTYVGGILGGLYYWPSPPYAAGTATNDPEYGGTPISANSFGLVDDHYPKSFLKPYKYAGVNSDQVYQFQCPYYNNNQWVPMWPLIGTLPITRIVNYTNGNQIWYYEITKSGMTAAANLP